MTKSTIFKPYYVCFYSLGIHKKYSLIKSISSHTCSK